MKKIIAVFMLTLVMGLVLVGCAKVREPIQIDFGDDTDMARAVVEYVEANAQNWIGDVTEISEIADVYPCGYFEYMGNSFVEDFEQGRPLRDMILPFELWKVITKSRQLITVFCEDELIRIDAIRTKGPLDMTNDVIIDKEVVISKINQSQISKVDEVIIATDLFDHITLVIIICDGDEYVVPFCTRPDFSNLENGEIYTAKEAMKALREWFWIDYDSLDE